MLKLLKVREDFAFNMIQTGVAQRGSEGAALASGEGGGVLHCRRGNVRSRQCRLQQRPVSCYIDD